MCIVIYIQKSMYLYRQTLLISNLKVDGSCGHYTQVRGIAALTLDESLSYVA